MPHVSDIMHPHFRVSKKSPHLATDELLQQYINEETYGDYFVNLSPYINDSGVCVPQHFSLHRAYILFRTLGLRHMTVVSHTNQVMGILTRKDLMGFAIEEKLERLLTHPPRKLSRSVVLALRKNYGHKHSQRIKDANKMHGNQNTNKGTNNTSTTDKEGGNITTNILSPNRAKGPLSPPTITFGNTDEKGGSQDGVSHGRTTGGNSELKPSGLNVISRSGSFCGNLQFLQNKRHSVKDTNIRLAENHNTNHVV